LNDAVVRLAESAGRTILRYYRRKLKVKQKDDCSPLTAADLAADRQIRQGLRKLTPKIPVISEESGIPDYGLRRKWKRFWLVDPLDGTKEFLSRNGEFTVNIALLENGVPVLGVVHAPAMGVTYAGLRGRGSWVKRGKGPARKVRLAGRNGKGGEVVAVSRSHRSEKMGRFLKALGGADTIEAGSSLKFCYVAEGRATLYARFGPTCEWDVAAGDCVIRNAHAHEARTAFRYNKRSMKNEGFVVGQTSAGVLQAFRRIAKDG